MKLRLRPALAAIALLTLACKQPTAEPPAPTPAPSTEAGVPLYDGLGPHTRKVTTSSPEAQRYFDQGLNLLYAFNHDEAIR